MNKRFILGVDVGGSHIAAGLVDPASGDLVPASVRRDPVIADSDPEHIIKQWTDTLLASLSSVNDYQLTGISLAMPGPFNYQEGISLMNGVNKYKALYGINVREALQAALDLPAGLPIWFENDAVCFGLGESLYDDRKPFGKIIAVTLGTGFGSTFLENNRVLKEGKGVAPNGELYNVPYLDGSCEDYISSKWLLGAYHQKIAGITASGKQAADSVYTIAQRAIRDKEKTAIHVFNEFGAHLASCLSPWITAFGADCVIIGGSIAKSAALFLPAFNASLAQKKLFVPIKISEYMELSAIRGAAALGKEKIPASRRRSSQPMLPVYTAPIAAGSPIATGSLVIPGSPIAAGSTEYNLYPSFNIGNNRIFAGYDSLAQWMVTQKNIMIEGFPGVDWEIVRSGLSEYFQHNNIKVSWHDTAAFQQSPAIIAALVKPFIGQPGEVWGKQANLSLSDFYDMEKFAQLKETAPLNIIIGTGASFANRGSLVYIDLPKNEIQYRMRAGRSVSLTETGSLSNAEIYKRLYFVDWPVNKHHRQTIYGKIDVVADGQWGDTITWAFSGAIYKGLEHMSRSVIRARPWFEPGTWGGQWLKKHIPALNQDEVNYAWSFELIVPENGLVLDSDGQHLEVAFDWLMENQAVAILGAAEKTFGTEFPIRFDFLDTFDGGNLSIQCHPTLPYIQEHFGERITQDETYYILDCAPDADVWLGFQDNIDPAAFRAELEQSVAENIPVDMEKHVQRHHANRHDLFLIPSGTIHSSGKNNLVLEISATPYIFTFKMYDWLRLDLNGELRPINIEHAFNNLDFTRKGEKITKELISHPSVLEEKDDYRLVHLPTHPEHFYDVHRLEFTGEAAVRTEGKCHVLMVVEGEAVSVITNNGETHRFHFAETFVIPAATGSYRLINEGASPIKIVKAFIKSTF